MITAHAPRISVRRFVRSDGPTPTLDAPVELKGHTPQSETTIHGRSAIFFGLPFFAMGVFMVLIATDIIHLKQKGMKSPPELIAISGLVFVTPGAWLILHGIRGFIRKSRAAVMRARRPDDPWLADHPWKPHGVRDSQARRVASSLIGMCYMTLFAAPMNYIAFGPAKSMAMKLLVIGTLDSIVALFAFVFLYRLARWMKHGAATLRFQRFPFHLGETLDVEYVPSRFPAGIEQLTCTLRCIREAYETRPGFKRQQEHVVPYCLHEQSKTIDARSHSSFPNRAFPIDFDIPSDAPGTTLANRPPTYWELEVSADSPGIDVSCRFLIPIYDRAGWPRI